MINNYEAPQDVALRDAIREKNQDEVRKYLNAGANINSQCPDDLSTPLHLAVDSGCEMTIPLVMSHNPNYALVNSRNETAAELAIRMKRKDIAEQLINAEFEGCADAEAVYQLMKRSSVEALELLFQSRNVGTNCPKESLEKAWRRLETKNVHTLPQMEKFVQFQLVQFDWKAISSGEGNLTTSAVSQEDLRKELVDGIGQLEKKQNKGGNLCHDVDLEFMEMLRAILKLLCEIRDIDYFPVEKLKFCIAIYLAIYDKKPLFDMFHLLINKVMVVDFLKQFRTAQQNQSQIIDKRMTEKLLLDMNKIFLENFNLKREHILELWISHLKYNGLIGLYSPAEQTKIYSFLRKTPVKKTTATEEIMREGKILETINGMFMNRTMTIEIFLDLNKILVIHSKKNLGRILNEWESYFILHTKAELKQIYNFLCKIYVEENNTTEDSMCDETILKSVNEMFTGKEMTKDLFLNLKKTLIKHFQTNQERVFDEWTSYLKQKDMTELYTESKCKEIYDFLQKISVRKNLASREPISVETYLNTMKGLFEDNRMTKEILLNMKKIYEKHLQKTVPCVLKAWAAYNYKLYTKAEQKQIYNVLRKFFLDDNITGITPMAKEKNSETINDMFKDKRMTDEILLDLKEIIKKNSKKDERRIVIEWGWYFKQNDKNKLYTKVQLQKIWNLLRENDVTKNTDGEETIPVESILKHLNCLIKGKEMTIELLLDLNQILIKHSQKNQQRILEEWASYFKYNDMSELYTQMEQVQIRNFLQKIPNFEVFTSYGNINVANKEPKPAKKMSTIVNDMFTSKRLEREFKTLFKTFSNLKDLYSLRKVTNYLNTIENINFDTKSSCYTQALGILRIMQIIGESLKSTILTQSISGEVQSFWLGIAPERLFSNLTALRDFLSHDFTDQKYSFYKEAGENKNYGDLFATIKEDLLKLKLSLKRVYTRTIYKCMKVFLVRLLQSDSAEWIHSNCKVFDLQSKQLKEIDLKADYFFQYLVNISHAEILPCIKLFLMIDDLEDLKHLISLQLHSVSLNSSFNPVDTLSMRDEVKKLCQLAAERGYSDAEMSHEQMTRINENMQKECDTNDLNAYFHNTVSQKIGRKGDVEGTKYIRRYMRNEIAQQLSEMKFNDRQHDEVFKKIHPFNRNVLDIDRKYDIIKTVKTIDDEKVSRMKEEDKKNLSSVFKQMLQDIQTILSVGDNMTDAEIVSMITSYVKCDSDLLAIEMIMLDALEILIHQNILPPTSSFVTSLRPVISGRSLRHCLAHDSLVYDAICRNSNPRVVVLLNAICLYRYLKVDLFNHPEQYKVRESGETRKIDFQTIAGKYTEQNCNRNIDQLENIKSLIACLVVLSPDAVKPYCDDKNVDDRKWQELIHHAISSKDETTALKLIDHIRLCNLKLPISSFLTPAVTKRMPKLVERTCELDPANIDNANSDQQTALYRAVEVGCEESVKILLRFNASVMRSPFCPLSRALQLRRDTIFDTLMSTVDIRGDTDKNVVYLFAYNAVLANRVDVLEKIKTLVPITKGAYFIAAVQYNHLESAVALKDTLSGNEWWVDPVWMSGFQHACSNESKEMFQLFLSSVNFPHGLISPQIFVPLKGGRRLLRLFFQSIKLDEEDHFWFAFFVNARRPKLARDVIQAGYPFINIPYADDWALMKSWLPRLCRCKPQIIDKLTFFDLCQAISHGMNAFAKKIFKKVLPKLSNTQYASLMMEAIKADVPEDFMMLKYYLKNGRNKNHTADEGLTPLGFALSLGEQLLEIVNNKNTMSVKLKLEHKAIIELVFLLFCKANAALNKIFTQYPLAIVEVQDSNELVNLWVIEEATFELTIDGKPILVQCIEQGVTEVVDSYILLGFDLDQVRRYRYPDGTTVLHYMVQHHHSEMFKHLVGLGFDETLADSKGNTMLHLAIISNNLEIVEYFWDNEFYWIVPNEDGYTPVLLALQRFNVFSRENERLFNLVKTRPDFTENLRSFPFREGKTLLHIAVSYDNVSTDCIKSLIYETDINSTDDDGLTPLHYALRQGNHRLTKVLVEAGAILFPKGVDEAKIFSDLASVLAARTDIVEILDITILKDCVFEDKNLLQLAVLQNNYSLCELLVESDGFDKTILDNEGNTLLHLAASVNSVQLTSLLLNKGLSIDAVNSKELTPLQMAIQGKNKKTISYIRMKSDSLDCEPDDEYDGKTGEQKEPLLPIIENYKAMLTTISNNSSENQQSPQLTFYRSINSLFTSVLGNNNSREQTAAILSAFESESFNSPLTTILGHINPNADGDGSENQEEQEPRLAFLERFNSWVTTELVPTNDSNTTQQQASETEFDHLD